jgi:peptidoglycan/LPS O-acetylase OafA/YrhL
VPRAIVAQPLEDLTNPTSKSRIPELDGLRGIAISLVVVFHYFYFGPSTNHHLSAIRSLYVHFEQLIVMGWSGVDLFFVLSGFLIGGILMDVRASESYFKVFYLRRFFRIIPVYYAWILIYFLIAAVASSFVRAHVVGGELPERKDQIIPLLLFLQNFGFMNYSMLAGAWFLPTWSLAVEEQFYLVSPLVIRLLSRRALYAFLGFVIFFAPLLRLWVIYHVPPRPNDSSLAYTLMPCRADALAIGAVAAGLWRNGRFRLWLNENTATLYGLVAIFLAGVLIMLRWFPGHEAPPTQSVGYTWIAIFYVLILLLALAKPSGPVARVARIAWLGALGRVSYCLYLVHTGILLMCHAFLTAALKNHVSSWQLIASNGFAAILCYFIARLSWTYFEHPLLQRGHAFKY